MWPVTGQFLAALTTSHTLVTKVDVWFDGDEILTGIPVSDGAVTVDRGSKVRRTLSLTVPDLSLRPRAPDDPLAPFGQQLRVRRGIRYADGSEELVPVGWFRIDAPKASRGRGPVSLTATGLEVLVAEHDFEGTWTTAGFASVVDAIEALIMRTIPAAAIVNLTGGDGPVPPTLAFDAQKSPWDAVEQLARVIGAEVYVDADGVWTIAPVPSIDDPVAWMVASGEGGVLLDVEDTWSREGVYTAVCASGENQGESGPPVSATVYNLDPLSPTRHGGPFGQRVRWYSNPALTTTGDCEVAAEALLRESTAPNRGVGASAVPNPALEAGDVLLILDGDQPERHLLQSFSVPLGVDGEFGLTTRSAKAVET